MGADHLRSSSRVAAHGLQNTNACIGDALAAACLACRPLQGTTSRLQLNALRYWSTAAGGRDAPAAVINRDGWVCPRAGRRSVRRLAAREGQAAGRGACAASADRRGASFQVVKVEGLAHSRPAAQRHQAAHAAAAAEGHAGGAGELHAAVAASRAPAAAGEAAPAGGDAAEQWEAARGGQPAKLRAAGRQAEGAHGAAAVAGAAAGAAGAKGRQSAAQAQAARRRAGAAARGAAQWRGLLHMREDGQSLSRQTSRFEDSCLGPLPRTQTCCRIPWSRQVPWRAAQGTESRQQRCTPSRAQALQETSPWRGRRTGSRERLACVSIVSASGSFSSAAIHVAIASVSGAHGHACAVTEL